MTGLSCHFVTSTKRKLNTLFFLSASFWLTSCDQNTPLDTGNKPTGPAAVKSAELSGTTINQRLINAISEQYQRAHSSAIDSLNAIKALVQEPSKGALDAARSAWQQSHDDYLLAQVSQSLSITHPVLDSPISCDNNIAGHTLEIRLDQYPAIPGYLDSVSGYPQSGIIHTEIPVTLDRLMKEHQLSDTAYVALGFHALEVMLFEKSTQAEERYQDFISAEPSGKKGIDTAKRRRELSLLLAKQIVDDITLRAEAWSLEKGHYQEFVLTLSDTTVKEMLREALNSEQNAQQTNAEHIPSEILSQRRQLIQRLLSPTDTVAPAEKSP